MPAMTKIVRLSLILAIITASVAQPSWHRLHPRYLHPARGAENHPHAARHPSDPLITENQSLYEKYKSRLALRTAALSIFERIESATVQRRSLDERTEDNVTLQEKINDLETSFQSLMTLLAAEYGVAFGASSETSSSTTSMPSQTSMPLPGSIVAATTIMGIPASSTPSIDPAATDGRSSTTATSLASAAPSTYSFDPMSSSNVAVYYGQTDQTSNVPLTTVCADPNVDMIVLAFVTTFYTPYPSGSYPTLNMGSHCWAASSAQVSAGATGLIDCVSDGFAELVRSCQTNYGKKVFLSLGGAIDYSDTRIASDTMANSLADTLWDLFLGGSGLESIRPFGDVVLDGIDIDNENPANAEHFPVLISSLREHFASSSTTKPYYLSAAPQCPRPDQSIPLESMQTEIDFVWPQFYDNPACNLDSDGFLPSLQAWAEDLKETQDAELGGTATGGFVDIGNGVSSPRLLVGSPAFTDAGSGFVEGNQFEDIVAQVKNASLGGRFNQASPLGGFMFWDGAYGEESTNVDGMGESYMQIVKDALG